jgi:hypothetical protein
VGCVGGRGASLVSTPDPAAQAVVGLWEHRPTHNPRPRAQGHGHPCASVQARAHA